MSLPLSLATEISIQNSHNFNARYIFCPTHSPCYDHLTKTMKYEFLAFVIQGAASCGQLSVYSLHFMSETKFHKTPWPESANELYRPSDSRM
jgi:hypothetical protein